MIPNYQTLMLPVLEQPSAEEISTRDVIELARHLIHYNIGCRDEENLHLKKVDEEFFEQ